MKNNPNLAWKTFNLPPDIYNILNNSPEIIIPGSREELLQMSLGTSQNEQFNVQYDVENKGVINEAIVTRCRNGIAVNYPDPYMRRRDPECMLVADNFPSEKTKYFDRFGKSFNSLRASIFSWLQSQKLILLPFISGNSDFGYDSLLLAPLNAAFFAAALSDLQGMLPSKSYLNNNFNPRAIIFLAPPFRHTHCNGKQVVIHNRTSKVHEIHSLNLYPGPSAKKGVYGILLNIGEEEGWITAHASTVAVVTPYDNIITIMHEAASGGGKSEMLEYAHRQTDGRLLLGENCLTKEQHFLAMGQTCSLRPLTDDMALCPPELQDKNQLLRVLDAEDAWFLRVNHINNYGIDPSYEKLSIHPPEPLIFMNLQARPEATCLIWEHIEDSPGVPCPNPRMIIPRRLVKNIINEPLAVDVRSFGIRTPPCTTTDPSYGIIGLLHSLPPALAWLWRLVAPRGFSNPSITSDEGLTSEGVGSYWPFATGRQVVQANLLLHQIQSTPKTGFTLTPNQYIGAWKVGFMALWIAREYLARRSGAHFRTDQLVPARCPLLGYALRSVQIEGTHIATEFLQVEQQPEVGPESYDLGAIQLQNFFAETLKPYLREHDLDPLGRKIIEAALDKCSVEEFVNFKL